MKVEEIIRARHEFEDSLRDFLDLASAMSEREIEIALARLADMLKEDQEQEASIRVSGALLKLYYDLRKQGIKSQHKRKRGFFGRYEDNSETLIDEITSWDLLPEGLAEIPQPDGRGDALATVKLLSP